MNARIFMDYCNEIDIASLFSRAALSDDDLGTTLRLHLICERMVEAWICACYDCPELFGNDKNKVLIECNDKITMAGNLGIPPEMVKSLKTINSMRNDLAHNPSMQNILDSRIQSLKDTLTEYFERHPTTLNMKETKLDIFDAEGQLTEEVSLESDTSKKQAKTGPVIRQNNARINAIRCIQS